MGTQITSQSLHPSSYQPPLHEGALPYSAVMKDRPHAWGEVASPVQSLEKVPKESVRKALKQAEAMAQIFNRQLRFRFRDESELFQIEVLEMRGAEEKVIRKIPPDGVVRFVENVQELFGALFDVEA
ncbi:MAG: hypothetical protein CSA35_04750 [Dethiosulfovibrio peptidovorans]|nr:MAG: hypothetical protein CSA35_04750 [Dethiosulfovibrio peptidovorans]